VDVDKIDFSHPRASHSVTHTYNLTYADEVPDQNKIVEGRWLDQNPELPQMSVEQGMAEKLDLKLGDQLTMTVGSKILQAEVTSIRSVVWENFKPNFYLIANPGLLESFPQTWLLSALIADHNKADLKQLLKTYPSLTLLDISELMARVRAIVEKATVALQFFFLFALASATIVLLAAIQTGKHEREIESSLLRALSADTSHDGRPDWLFLGLLREPGRLGNQCLFLQDRVSIISRGLDIQPGFRLPCADTGRYAGQSQGL
jgi:putative ABC transport system permease protein